MPVVGGIDIHRQQLTFDYVDTDSGEIARGRISPADRECLRAWLGRFAGRPDVAFALDGGAPGGGTWSRRWCGRESRRMSPSRRRPPRVAGPSAGPRPTAPIAGCCESCSRRGGSRSRGSPRNRCLEARAVVRLYKDLLDERTGWLQRVQASLFHMGVPELNVTTMSVAGRQRMAEAELSPATRTTVDVRMTRSTGSARI